MRKSTAKNLLQKVVKDYSKISTEFSNSRKHNWSEFESYLPYIKDQDILIDLGCGNGRFYKFIKEHRKLNYTGIDNNPELINFAKKLNPGVEFENGDILDIPVQDKSVDVIACIAALHHIPSKELRKDAIQETHRVLREKGIYILSVWNLFQRKYRKYIWKARFKSIFTLGRFDSRDTLIPWGKSGVKRYYYAFTVKELKRLVEKAGFKILKEEIGNNIVLICQKS
jgi:ubiquinone/menaquinone biosynthesis C-methylase UbiE